MPGTVSGQPASSSASRAMSSPWSPARIPLPAITSSTSAGSNPMRAPSACRHCASNACGWMPCNAPSGRPLPRGVRTASRIHASVIPGAAPRSRDRSGTSVRAASSSWQLFSGPLVVRRLLHARPHGVLSLLNGKKSTPGGVRGDAVGLPLCRMRTCSGTAEKLSPTCVWISQDELQGVKGAVQQGL